jgi:prepilin-type N-terminal cleavage/methylation domain-containing protein
MNRLKSGFTLIELLVVISIIAFLLAIIMPAVGRAKDKSRLVVCKARLHGLVMGCRAYATENKGKLPLAKVLYNPHNELIEMLTGGGHIESRESYYCPSEKSKDRKCSENNFAAGNIGYFYYSYSDRPANRNLSTYILKIVKWPRVLSDTRRHNTWVFSDTWYAGISTAHRWYKKGVNYAVLDGSVHMVKRSPRSEFN